MTASVRLISGSQVKATFEFQKLSCVTQGVHWSSRSGSAPDSPPELGGSEQLRLVLSSNLKKNNSSVSYCAEVNCICSEQYLPKIHIYCIYVHFLLAIISWYRNNWLLIGHRPLQNLLELKQMSLCCVAGRKTQTSRHGQRQTGAEVSGRRQRCGGVHCRFTVVFTVFPG